MKMAALLGLFFMFLPMVPDAKPMPPLAVVGAVIVAASCMGMDLVSAIRERKP